MNSKLWIGGVDIWYRVYSIYIYVYTECHCIWYIIKLILMLLIHNYCNYLVKVYILGGMENLQPIDAKIVIEEKSKSRNATPYIVLSCNLKLPIFASEEKGDPTTIWEGEIQNQLERRGFHIEERIHKPDGLHYFLLSMSRKRIQILDARRNQKSFAALSDIDRFQLAQDSLDILRRVVNSNFGISTLNDGYLGKNKQALKCQWSAWIAHDASESSRVRLRDTRTIRDYFGLKSAMYFCFLSYYSQCLLFLAVFGCLVFLNEVCFIPNNFMNDIVYDSNLHDIFQGSC